jgi:hypothetical protein
MQRHFVRKLLWWLLVSTTIGFALLLWPQPLNRPIPVATPIFYDLGQISVLPTYTVDELEALRGSPLDPSSPNTLYYPPNVNSFEELPPCVHVSVDDPTTKINEDQIEHERRKRDGTSYRNLLARVVSCRVVPQETSNISEPAE